MAVLQAVSIHKKGRFRGSLQEPYPMCLLRWSGGGEGGGSGKLGKHPLVNRQGCGEREDGKTDTKDGEKLEAFHSQYCVILHNKV